MTSEPISTPQRKTVICYLGLTARDNGSIPDFHHGNTKIAVEILARQVSQSECSSLDDSLRTCILEFLNFAFVPFFREGVSCERLNGPWSLYK